ncbi:MAG: FUN14 domain-containing protein [Planctomycetes bacterium]|nr:FUN14 domain-containing protein [Planctomycetota bacterium]
MTDPERTKPPSHAAENARRMWEDVKAQPPWKKVALVASVLLIVVGFVLLGVESSEPNPPAAGAGGAAATGLVPTEDGGSPAAAADETQWAPVFLRFGFSFFIGFSLGAALRTVLKIVVVFVGLFFLTQVALAEFGFVEVHWAKIGEEFGGFFDRIGEEADSVRKLLTGRLPSAGLAVLGLYAGLRRS